MGRRGEGWVFLYFKSNIYQNSKVRLIRRAGEIIKLVLQNIMVIPLSIYTFPLITILVHG